MDACRIAVAALAAGISVGIGSNVSADDHSWINPGGGQFLEPTNWDLGLVPGVGDIAIFDLDSLYQVSLSDSTEVGLLWVSRGDVSLTGPTHELVLPGTGGHALMVGWMDGEVGSLTLSDCTVSTTRVEVGFNANSSGSLIVSGPNTVLQGGRWSGNVWIGNRGTGSIDVLDGARMTFQEFTIAPSDTGSGSMLISGTDSLVTVPDSGTFWVGNTGQGVLTVQDGGGIFLHGGKIVLGENPGSYGEAYFYGPDTFLECDDNAGGALEIGRSGDGIFELHQIACNITDMSIGVADREGIGSVLLSGCTFDRLKEIRLYRGSLTIDQGSDITMDGSLRVSGAGSFAIIDGPDTLYTSRGVLVGGGTDADPAVCYFQNGVTAYVPNNQTGVGDNARLIIDGTETSYTSYANWGFSVSGQGTVCEALIQNGAYANIYRLLVGNQGGQGDFKVMGDGTVVEVMENGYMEVGLNGGTGYVYVDPNATLCTPILKVGDGGTIDGEVIVGDCGGGGLLASGGVRPRVLEADGLATFTDLSIDVYQGGVITGDGVIPTNVVNHGGRLSPQSLSGDPLIVDANYDQLPLAGMTIELRGRYEGEYDSVVVTGNVSLSGDLLFDPVPGVEIPMNWTYHILQAGNISGTFDTARLEKPNGIRLQPEYTGTAVDVHTVQGLSLKTDPLYKGQKAGMLVENAAPRSSIYLFYSLQGTGETYVPQLNITLGLANPKFGGGPYRSDDSGQTTFTVNVPNVKPSPYVSMQVATQWDASNVVRKQLQN